MIIEHGPVGADMVEVWADAETCSEMDKNGDPVYEYELSSFFGTLGKRTPAENIYYISMTQVKFIY